MEYQQIAVACDDMAGIAADRKRDKFIVSWIATGSHLDVDLYPFSLMSQRGKKAPNIFFVYVSSKLFSAQHLVQLIERHGREQDCASQDSKIERLTRT